MKRGFTLIEILVVTSIISVLSSVVLASLNSARTKAQIAKNQALDANAYHVVGGSLVGEWSFDDCFGSTAKDTSGSNIDGTLTGSQTWSADTPYSAGCALSFNGSGDYVTVPINAKLDIANALTVSVWVKSSNWSPTAVWRAVLDRGRYGIYVRPAGDGLRFQLNLAGIGFVTLDTGAVSTDQWHFVVGIYNKDGGARNLKLYVDGILQSTGTYTNPIQTPGGGMNFGLYTGNYYNGLMDNIRIYADALPLAEIQKLYAKGKVAHPDVLAAK